MFRVALVAAVAALAVPASAQAYWDLAADGNPLITTGWFSEPAVQLSVCPPGAATCTPVAWSDGKYLPGDTAPGTTFEILRDGVAERSPAWQGPVRRTGLPTLTGDLYATGDAQPQAGTWTGGWGNDVSSLSLAACRTPAGTDCFSLPQINGCPVPCVTVKELTAVAGGLAGIPAAFAGRYLFATERRIPGDQRGRPLAVPALWSTNHAFDLPAETTLSSVSAPVGPLGIPSTVVPPAPTAAPAVTLRAKALRRKGRIHVGRVTCAERCTVTVRVSGGGRKAYLTSFSARGSKAITAPARRGKLTVRVRVDGKLLANGKVSAKR